MKTNKGKKIVVVSAYTRSNGTRVKGHRKSTYNKKK